MKTLLLLAAVAALYPVSLTDAILTITGAYCAEELDEQTVERFEALHDSPLDLNASGRSRLQSSGIFTEYQVASLLDYRGRSGDILSWTELGLIDGFSPALADALKEFCTLDSKAAPGETESRKVHQTIMVRSAIKQDGKDKLNYCYGGKYNFSLGERLEFNWGSRTTYSEQRFSPGTASLAVYGKRHLGKIVLGDYNARFGQGLAQWSGFSMSSYSTVNAMMRKGTGLSPSTSFTRNLHGLGVDFDLGAWSLAGAWDWPEGGMLHAGWNGRNATLGATAIRSGSNGYSLSADWRIGTAGFCFYGESCMSSAGGFSTLAGLMHSPAYGVKAAILGKYVNGEIQTVAGFQNSWITLTADALWKDTYKALFTVSHQIPAGPVALTPSVRFQAKYKPDGDPLRIEVRAETKLEWKEWNANVRYDRVWCSGAAWLWYAEGGYRSGLSAFLRFTLFMIDDWSDRIWVYERDAPGNFNVPAYYGRGFSASAVVSYKHGKQSLHLRAGLVQYPWNLKEKDSRTEVKLQYQLKL